MNIDIGPGGRQPKNASQRQGTIPKTPVTTAPWFQAFVKGSPADLSDTAIARIREISRLLHGCLPEIAAGKKYSTLLYDPDDGGGLDVNAVLLKLRSTDGLIVDAGAGEEWFETDFEHPLVKPIIEKFGATPM